MVVVLIHWRIRPTEKDEAAFFDYWKNKATIKDKSSLAAEYLSAPMSPQEVPFRVDDLTFGHGILDCKHFINVGIWETWDAFYEQVGKNMDDDAPVQPFEADRRTRTVLRPRQSRIGKWTLPSQGTCE